MSIRKLLSRPRAEKSIAKMIAERHGGKLTLANCGVAGPYFKPPARRAIRCGFDLRSARHYRI